MSTRLTTTDIANRIGLTLTVKFITDTLGVPFREREKKACFWDETDYPTICSALSTYALERATNPLTLIAAATAPAKKEEPAVEEDDLSILG